MLTLGVETSCDETSVALTSGRKVLANAVSSSVHLHKKYGGVVPEIASRLHVEYIMEVLETAMESSGKKIDDVKLVAVTNGPGLVGALLTGISVAKSISYAKRLPLIGVNHILAHLYSAFLNEDVPDFPFTGLVVSGGHTALFRCDKVGDQKLLGQTQDDAVGEAYDKVAKILKLGYPGGPVIDKMARRAKGKSKILFPRSYLGKDSLDFSFSGVKTAVLYYVQKLRAIDEDLVCDIANEFQEAILDVVVEKVCRAVNMTKTSGVVIGGGVAANSRLREKLSEAGSARGFKVHFPKFEYCLDNAAMVGVLGEALYKRGHRSDLYLSADPNLKA